MNAASLSEAPRALVTGLGGFTGRYLARELEAAGYEVHGTSHGSETVGPRMHAVDLCRREDLERLVEQVQPEVVAHLAAISFIAHGDVEAIYRVNVIGTRNLLETLAGLERPPRAVLLASSANIYGNATVSLIDESIPAAPANDYAVSKLAMECMARLWMDRLPIVITRPFNYTGVGQAPKFLLPKIVSHFQRGERVIELGDMDVERDFCDVRMVAQAYAALLAASAAGRVFNICSGTAVSLREVLRMMADIAGYEIEVRVNPAFVRVNEVRRLQGDASALRGAIGSWSQISLRDTLSWMYQTGFNQ